MARNGLYVRRSRSIFVLRASRRRRIVRRRLQKPVRAAASVVDFADKKRVRPTPYVAFRSHLWGELLI